HSRCSTVLDHPLQCCSHIPSLTDLLHRLRAVSRGFVLRVRPYARLSAPRGQGFTFSARWAGQLSLTVLTFSAHCFAALTPLSIYPRHSSEGTVRAFGASALLLCPLLTAGSLLRSPPGFPSLSTASQLSRGKFDCFRRTTA